MNLSDLVRDVAVKDVVSKERARGVLEFSIAVSAMKEKLSAKQFPRNHTPQICEALRSKKFLREQGLEIVRTDGPPSLTSTTVVFHYRFLGSPTSPLDNSVLAKNSSQGARVYDPAKDPLLQMRGMLKDVFAEFGGGEAFLREMRRDPADGRFA